MKKITNLIMQFLLVALSTISFSGCFLNPNGNIDIPDMSDGTGITIGKNAGKVISSLKGSGDYTIVVQGSVSKDDFANINQAITGLSDESAIGIILDFSEANFTTIPESAFNGCSKLKGIIFPKDLINISANAFNGCSKLKSLTIPNTVTSIGNFAFNGCTGLTTLRIEDGDEPLTLGYNNYRDISYYSGQKGLFRDCTIENLYLGRNIEYADYNDKSSEAPFHKYGLSAFACIQSTNMSVVIGPKVTRIQAYAFIGCEGLTSITIDSMAQITSIERNAFDECKNLSSIVIPPMVTNIGYAAFHNCKKLKSLTIPESVTNIGNQAFNECIGLTTLRIEDGDEMLTLGYNNYNSNSYSSDQKGLFRDCTIENLYLGRNIEYADYNDKSTDAAFYAYGYSAFADIQSTNMSIVIGPKVTSIQAYAFAGCKGLTSIMIDSMAQINSIERNAFDGCKNLSSFEIPPMVSKIEYGAFAGCSKLKELSIPGGVRSIGNTVFVGCTSLNKLRIEDGEDPLRLGCNHYNSNSYSSDQEGLFRDCTLETLYLGRNIEYIDYNDRSGDAAFYAYGYSAFANITSLTSVTINVPENVSSFMIGLYAFKGCSGISKVTFTPDTNWSRSSSVTGNKDFVDIQNESAAASILKSTDTYYLFWEEN